MSLKRDFKRHVALGAAVLVTSFGGAFAQAGGAEPDASAFDDIAAAAKAPAAPVVRTKFFDRLSFFSPAITRHLGAGDDEYNEVNFGALVGVNLNKNPKSRISSTIYAGGFNNSYGNFSPMINATFETRRGIGMFGEKDVLGAGIAMMAVRYPAQDRKNVIGPVPYIKLLTGDRPFSLQVGYIAVNSGKPSFSKGTFVLSFSSHLSSLFSTVSKKAASMKKVQNPQWSPPPFHQP